MTEQSIDSENEQENESEGGGRKKKAVKRTVQLFGVHDVYGLSIIRTPVMDEVVSNF